MMLQLNQHAFMSISCCWFLIFINSSCHPVGFGSCDLMFLFSTKVNVICYLCYGVHLMLKAVHCHVYKQVLLRFV